MIPEDKEIIRLREKWFRDNYKRFENEVKHNITKTQGPMKDYLHDLIQIATLQFLNKPLSQQYQMLNDDKVQGYLLVTCKMHIQSSSSPFYNQVRKHKLQTRSGALPEGVWEQNNIENTDLWDCYQQEMDKLGFYERKLIEEKYFNGLSYDDIHKKYQITKASLITDMKKTFDIIRKNCEHCTSTPKDEHLW